MYIYSEETIIYPISKFNTTHIVKYNIQMLICKAHPWCHVSEMAHKVNSLWLLFAHKDNAI